MNNDKAAKARRSGMRVKCGDLIRTRRTKNDSWFYGIVIRQDESGLIHLKDQRNRRRELTSIDAQWMHDNGMLQIKGGE